MTRPEGDDHVAASTPGDELSQRSLFEPSPDRLSPEHPYYSLLLAAHRDAIEAGEGGYWDPVTGYYVVTAAEHLRRGRCCANDCRHCPYVA